MRLARLDLARYGRFSDYSLDFGAAPAGGSDFHIVYGLNESGKSTTAAAIVDLLFGIEKQSAYGVGKGRASVPNWHAYNTMRIGARLELGGRPHEVARLKREKNSLVDADDRPFDENLLKSELAGVDRDAFRTMFSLDDDSLEEGGEAILQSHGDLGQLLFSASAGLAEISGRLDALRERAEAFYRPRASTTELAQKKRELDDLEAERRKADTLASAYAELVRQRDEAKRAYEAAARVLGERRQREGEIQRLLGALPHLIALRQAESLHVPLAGLPTPPDGWREELERLRDEAIRLSAQKESAESAIQSLDDDLAGIVSDAAALALADRVDAWRELRSRYDSAIDIPVRQGELAAKRGGLLDILRRLGRENEAEPQRLLLSVGAVGALEELADARSGVASKLTAAREALDEAQSALARALEEAPRSDADGRGGAMAALKTRLAEARRDDSLSRLRAARAEAEKLERKLGDALAGLQPWRGDVAALAAVQVPSETETAELRRRLSEVRASGERHRAALSETSAEAERLKAELAVAARASDLPSDEAAAMSRAEREAVWRAHRAALDGRSADDFEAAMRRDDAFGSARLAGARELAAARERAVKLAGIEVDRARARADCEAAEAAIAALDREIAALSPVPPPGGRDPLSFIDAWRLRRDEALALGQSLHEARRSVSQAEADRERAREALSASLREAAVAHDERAGLDALIEAADGALAAEAKFEVLRQEAKKRRADIARAEGKFKAALDDDARWREAWRCALAGSWLGEGGAEPSPVAVRPALKALDELRAAMKECAELAHRIEAMEHDKQAFAAEVSAVEAALRIDNAHDDVARRADAIASRIAAARDSERRRGEKVEASAAARAKLAKIVEDFALHARRASAMTAFFAVDTLAEVAGKLEDCRRRDRLSGEIAGEIRAIVAANIAPSFEAARAALEEADGPALAAEHEALKIHAPLDVERHAETHSALREAERRLDAVGGDDAVALIEERRRTVLEEIKDGARRYLILRAGVAAADEALGLYRDRHRGAMMERASRAFSLISRGAYRGLTTAPNGRSETLIALGADGGSKEAEQLSKGARFQLYLALRVAGYHELAKARAPAPFVADDIMETFDHFRAEEALRLFADMGRVGQVIYLTHHQHLAEIARQVCPEAKVHELNG